MTISTEVRKAGPFIGNDSASVFPFAFKVFKAADLIVVRRQDNIGTETTLVLDSDYHVTLNSNQDTTPGGVVTLVAGALASGFTLVVSSELPYLQPTDLTNQGGFYPKVITNALDRLTIFCQQLAEITGRTLKLPITAPTNISAEIPLPNPSKLIAWNETGTGLTTVSPQSLVTSIAYGSATADLFAGDGATTTFPLSTNPASVNNLDVSIGGHSQRPVQGGVGDYSWNGGASITFVAPPPAPTVPGDKNVLVRYMQAIPVSGSEALHAQTREALRRSYAEAGYNLVDGSFETGGTLTAAEEVLLQESTGAVYAWTGALPKNVAPGIDPTVVVGFELRTDVVLRGALAEINSAVSIAGESASSLKRKANKVVYASEYGFDGSQTDFKSLLKQFMAESKNKVIDVDIYTSGVAAVADNTSVTRHNNAVIYALADVTLDTDAAASNQGQILEAGNNTTFTGVKIDGLGLRGNGILNNGKTGVTVQLCDLSNGLGQGIHDFGGINSKYYDNDIYRCLHGVQLWLSKTARIRGNHIGQVVGGIWSAVATDVLAWGNIVHDCEDVGIDWEGGIDCHSFENTLWSCAHGELAIFATGPELVGAGIQMGNLSHCYNKVRRVSTFINRNGDTVQNDLDDVGSICVYGIDAAMSGPVEVKYNTVHVESSTATIPGSLNAIHTRVAPNQSTHYLEICNNDVVTAYSNAFRLQELNKLNFSNNSFTFRGVNPTRHEIKNIHSGRINKNTFVFDGVNPPSELLYLYTDKAMRGGLRITKNDFSSAGETAIAVDQYISGRAVTLIDNMLPKSATGGVTCNNGLLRYVSQKLLFSVGDNGSFDVRNVSAVYKSASIGMGSVSMQMGGGGPLYRIAVQTNDIQPNAVLSAIDAGGAYNTGIFPNAARRVDFTSTSLTLVDSDGATENSAVIELTMTPRF